MTPTTKFRLRAATVHAFVLVAWGIYLVCRQTSGYEFGGERLIAFSGLLLAGVVISFALAVFAMFTHDDSADWRSTAYLLYLVAPLGAYLWAMSPSIV